jgi:hypothetical protein
MEAWVLKELVEQSELADEFIELVNSGRILRGVVERERVVTSMMLSLAR